MDEATARAALIQRVDDLERRILDLYEWIAEIGDDVADCAGIMPIDYQTEEAAQ
jgi:hypothetical protein